VSERNWKEARFVRRACERHASFQLSFLGESLLGDLPLQIKGFGLFKSSESFRHRLAADGAMLKAIELLRGEAQAHHTALPGSFSSYG